VWDANEVFLEVSWERLKDIFVFFHHTAGQNCNIKVANKFLKNLETFKYLERTVTKQSYIQNEGKNNMNLRNAWLPFSSESFVFPLTKFF
jgi:hypothetical protein